MLTHELLISKGFKLTEYPQGKYYEFVSNKDEVITKILKDDYNEMVEEVVIQMKEDFTNKLICIHTNVWDLDDTEFENILKEM